MKKKDIIRFSISILFIVVGIILFSISLRMEYGDSGKNFLQIVSCMCVVISLITVIGDDGAKGLKKAISAVKDFIGDIVEKIVSKLESIFGSRFGRGYGGNRVIEDYKDQAFYIGNSGKTKRIRRKKFKDMDNREKVRFFYERLINAKIKKGFLFHSSDSPNEIEEKLKVEKRITDRANEIFSQYNQARYNENSIVTEEQVEKIKKIYKNQ